MLQNKKVDKIYICHEYYEPSHLSALFMCGSEHGYEIADWIILDNKYILKRSFEIFIKEKHFLRAVFFFFDSFLKKVKLLFLHDSILIVGIAPYDRLMNKYEATFRKNYSIYFTSWHTWDGSCFPRGSYKNKEKYESIIHNAFKAIACVSGETERQLKRLNVTQVVNHAIDVGDYKKKAGGLHKKIKFIFLGRFVPIKHIDYLCEWIKSHDDGSVILDFVGDGILKQDILKVCNKTENARYLGLWTKEEIKNRLCEYDYLILPTEKESFGIVLIEALAAGVPCIAANVFGPNEIISEGKSGFKFSVSGGYKAFEEAIDKALAVDKDDYRSMVEYCINEADRYSYEAIWEKWSVLLKKEET